MKDINHQNTGKIKRPTFGLLVDSVIQDYKQAIWHGAVEQAKLSDANLITFNIASQSIPGANRQLNHTLEIINSKNLQGLILASATILDIIPANKMTSFIRDFEPLPLVSVGLEIDGIPSIVADNYQGTRAMIDHLIEDHDFHRIAYLQIFGDNPEAEERFRGYFDSLKDHKIQFDPELIVPGQYFGYPEEAVSLLLDERRTEVDAIAALNDDMALRIMRVLRRRGFRIPEDIGIVGFDCQEIGQYLSPSLTTAQQPLGDMGRIAVQLLKKLYEKEDVPLKVDLPTKMVVRKSCGCSHPEVIQPSNNGSNYDKFNQVSDLLSNRDEIISEILDTIQSSEDLTQLISRIVDAFIESINSKSSKIFINQLTLATENHSNWEPDVTIWQLMTTILSGYTHNLKVDNETLMFAENLIHEGKVCIAELGQKYHANLRFQTIKIANLFRQFSQRLTSSTNQKHLFDQIARELPKIGISGCLLVANEQFQTDTNHRRVLLAYQSEELFPLPRQGLQLNLGDFPEPRFFPKHQQYSYIVESIVIQNQDLGYIIFEASLKDASLYHDLATQISSALENVILIEQAENRTQKLLTAAEISRSTNNILEQEELFQNAVNLIKHRFNLYYVGIFVVDQRNQWAILRAGTGKAGALMLAKNWRLEVGGSSMIGRCITTGKADIQLDVENAPVHHRNPYMPNTNSELALPLINRGRVLGALTIQSDSANAFNKEDIAVLQTMADQIASSIANAQLFEQTQTALMDTETLLKVSRLASTVNNFDTYIQQVLDITLKSTGIDNGVFSIINPKSNRLEIAAHQIPDQIKYSLDTNGLEETLCDLVYRKRNTIIIPNLSEDKSVDSTELIKAGFKSYLGIPLHSKEEILGTLCTFNKSTIEPEDTRINLLHAISQQVVFAIDNFKLLQQTQKALTDLESTQRRYQQQAWSFYNQNHQTSGYRYKYDSTEPLEKLTVQEMIEVLHEKNPMVTSDGENINLSLPILLRDQPIGAVTLQADADRQQWSNDEIYLIQEISEQFALAAESLRLLDETQRRAARERLVAEITTKIRAINDPQSMIETAAEELRKALEVNRTQNIIRQDESSILRGDE